MEKKVLIFVIVMYFCFVVESAIYSPYQPDDCSEEELNKIWEDVFYESSDDLNYTCNEGDFYLYKNTSKGLYLIVGGEELDGDYKKVVAAWLNSTKINPAGLDNYFFYDNYYEDEDFLGILGGRSLSEGEIDDVYAVRFRHSPDDWEYESAGVSAQYLSNESDFSVGNYSAQEGRVFVNKGVETWTYIFHDLFAETFLQTANISNLTFDENSGWTKGFNAKDYFFGAENYSCAFVNESRFVNCTVESDGDVMFKPGEDFFGKVIFRIKVGKENFGYLYSNYFSVEVEGSVRPEYLGGLSSLIVPRDSYILEKNVGIYFKDNLGNGLTYKISENKNASISFSDETMIINWDKNFLGVEKVRIYANDGENEVASDYFLINLEGESTGGVENETENEENEEKNEEEVGETENIDENEEKNLVFWVLIGIFGFFGGVFLIILIYFIFFRKIEEKEEDEGSKKVDEYLREISN